MTIKYITPGNRKLDAKGKTGTRRRKMKVFNSSLPAGESCPGISNWCTEKVTVEIKQKQRTISMERERCYAMRGAFSFHVDRYREIMRQITMGNMFEEIMDLPQGSALRLHQSGDFFSEEYITKLRLVLATRPDLKVWAYTRSWRDAKLRAQLERLAELPHVRLFASVDPGIPVREIRKIIRKSDGWSLARIETDKRKVFANRKSLVCPIQTGNMPDCKTCGFCFLAKNTIDVVFIEH